jgi:hypothetical protein
MSERLPVHRVGRCAEGRYRTERLDCNGTISGYMEGAAEFGPDSVSSALRDVGIARLINELAPATGIDRRRLCGALDGGPPLAEEEASKVLDYFNVRVPMETSVAVG